MGLVTSCLDYTLTDVDRTLIRSMTDPSISSFLVLPAYVAKPVVVERERVRPLPVAIWHGFLYFLAPTVQVRIEKPMPREEADHHTTTDGHDPPVVVGRSITSPRVQPIQPRHDGAL